jgi:hypothetical protein
LFKLNLSDQEKNKYVNKAVETYQIVRTENLLNIAAIKIINNSVEPSKFTGPKKEELQDKIAYLQPIIGGS